MKMDILSVLEHKFPSFSKGQRTIAQFILKNYDKAAFMTAARLGEVTGVSESTVVRFAADLGYRGYPGMKKALQEIVRNRLTSVERIEAAESTMDGHDVLKAVLRADINNLQATLDEIDQDYFNQAVDMILSAKHIYIIILENKLCDRPLPLRKGGKFMFQNRQYIHFHMFTLQIRIFCCYVAAYFYILSKCRVFCKSHLQLLREKLA